MSAFPRVDEHTKSKLDLVDCVMRYEAGNMDPEEITDFFQELVNTGMAWQLQGSYGRKAHELIASGHIVATRPEDHDNGNT